MASILKVDELQGITAAGDITVTSEGGAATQSLQQGLAKAWVDYNQTTPSVSDSLNISSVTDSSAGESQNNFSSAMSSSAYSQTSSAVDIGVAYMFCTHDLKATTYSQTATFRNTSVTSLQDGNTVCTAYHGDLA